MDYLAKTVGPDRNLEIDPLKEAASLRRAHEPNSGLCLFNVFETEIDSVPLTILGGTHPGKQAHLEPNLSSDVFNPEIQFSANGHRLVQPDHA